VIAADTVEIKGKATEVVRWIEITETAGAGDVDLTVTATDVRCYRFLVFRRDFALKECYGLRGCWLFWLSPCLPFETVNHVSTLKVLADMARLVA
jgi:hypothetical protein